MKKNEIKSAVAGVISEVFAEEKFESGMINTVDLVDDFGMDSMTFIALVVVLEAMFEITIPDEMLVIESFYNVENITKIVEQELAKREVEVSAT